MILPSYYFPQCTTDFIVLLTLVSPSSPRVPEGLSRPRPSFDDEPFTRGRGAFSFRGRREDSFFVVSASAQMEQREEEHPTKLIPELLRLFYGLGWVTGTGGGISIRKGFGD